MRTSIRRVLVVMASVCPLLLSIGPGARVAGATSGAAGTATITGGICVGNTDTLSWTPPYPGVFNYFISESGPLGFGTLTLPPTQTSLTFTATVNEFGSTQAFILSADSRAQSTAVFATASTGPFEFPPQPFNWDGINQYIVPPNAVGNGFATVAFVYPEFDGRSVGNAVDAVTVTASPGGRTETGTISSATPNGLETFTFTGLANGTAYTFSAKVSNMCGSRTGTTSSEFTPVGPPVLTCAVSSTQVPPAVPKAQQSVTVNSVYGLASITNVAISNGTVKVPKVTVGTTGPVVVTATKTTAGTPTSWSFDITDINGNPHHCA